MTTETPPTWLDRLADRLDAAAGFVAVVMLILMVACVTLDILTANILGPLLGNPQWVSRMSSPVTTASPILLVWVGLLGGSVALHRGAHLGVDALVRVYPARLRLWLERASMGLVMAFSGLVLFAGGILVCRSAIASGTRMAGIEAFNQAWFYSVLVISGLLNLVFGAHRLARPLGDGADEPVVEAGAE